MLLSVQHSLYSLGPLVWAGDEARVAIEIRSFG